MEKSENVTRRIWLIYLITLRKVMRGQLNFFNSRSMKFIYDETQIDVSEKRALGIFGFNQP